VFFVLSQLLYLVSCAFKIKVFNILVLKFIDLTHENGLIAKVKNICQRGMELKRYNIKKTSHFSKSELEIGKTGRFF